MFSPWFLQGPLKTGGFVGSLKANQQKGDLEIEGLNIRPQ